MSKGENKVELVVVLPSMPKGEIVGLTGILCVGIDVNLFMDQVFKMFNQVFTQEFVMWHYVLRLLANGKVAHCVGVCWKVHLLCLDGLNDRLPSSDVHASESCFKSWLVIVDNSRSQGLLCWCFFVWVVMMVHASVNLSCSSLVMLMIVLKVNVLIMMSWYILEWSLCWS